MNLFEALGFDCPKLENSKQNKTKQNPTMIYYETTTDFASNPHPSKVNTIQLSLL